MNYPSATAATASHPTLARTIKRLRSVGEGRGARDLFPPASRPCCSTPSVTTSPYSTTVFQALREPLRCRALILLSSRAARRVRVRSEEHTSELQSHSDLVCRLLLEKKKKPQKPYFAEKKTKKKHT